MKKNIRIVIAGIICVALVVGYYYYLSNRDNKTVEDTTQLSEIDKITTKNLDKSYPSTPREVVKLYNQILVCFYNEDCSEDDINNLGGQARKLMDDELLENNPEQIYFVNLKADIQSYKDNKRTITQSDVSATDEITYKTVNGDECAYVNASYFIKEGSSYVKTKQEYVLRQDDEGKWKILAYTTENGNGDSSENE